MCATPHDPQPSQCGPGSTLAPVKASRLRSISKYDGGGRRGTGRARVSRARRAADPSVVQGGWSWKTAWADRRTVSLSCTAGPVRSATHVPRSIAAERPDRTNARRCLARLALRACAASSSSCVASSQHHDTVSSGGRVRAGREVEGGKINSDSRRGGWDRCYYTLCRRGRPF
jgi:hypothetical protein